MPAHIVTRPVLVRGMKSVKKTDKKCVFLPILMIVVKKSCPLTIKTEL